MKLLLPCFSLAALAWFSVPAQGATYTVRSRRDSGADSLRATLNRAQAGDTILLRTNGTLVLSGELILDKDLTLRGVPAGRNRLSGADVQQILHVVSGVTATLEGLTLEHGSAEGGEEAAGGALRNEGTLTVRDCTFLGNRSDFYGGAIWNTGALMLDRSRLDDNSASEFGGGIYNAGTLRIEHSMLSANWADTAGAIFNAGDLSIETSTLSENAALDDGAITNEGHATISNSTISRGHVAFDAGAIRNRGELLISNSTLSGNSADAYGAIENHGQLTLRNSTVADNFGTFSAGGIWNLGTMTMGNTILARNRHQIDDFPGVDLLGPFTSLGHNLIGDTYGASGFVASDLLDVDPLLGPLQDNGGFTATHALRAGSPAIDTGDNALVELPVGTDQRGEGFPRFVDGDGDGVATVDIGAVEYQGSDLQITQRVTGRPVFGAQVTYTLTLRNLGAELGEGVVVTDTLPNGVAFLSASATRGSLTTPPTGAGGRVVLNLGLLAPGDTAQLRITVRAPAQRPLSNTAVVTTASFDPNQANNQDTVVLRR